MIAQPPKFVYIIQQWTAWPVLPTGVGHYALVKESSRILTSPSKEMQSVDKMYSSSAKNVSRSTWGRNGQKSSATAHRTQSAWLYLLVRDEVEKMNPHHSCATDCSMAKTEIHRSRGLPGDHIVISCVTANFIETKSLFADLPVEG